MLKRGIALLIYSTPGYFPLASEGDLLELPLLPPYTSSSVNSGNIVGGVNYASAAAGILEETGQNLVSYCFSLLLKERNMEPVDYTSEIKPKIRLLVVFVPLIEPEKKYSIIFRCLLVVIWYSNWKKKYISHFSHEICS